MLLWFVAGFAGFRLVVGLVWVFGFCCLVVCWFPCGLLWIVVLGLLVCWYLVNSVVVSYLFTWFLLHVGLSGVSLLWFVYLLWVICSLWCCCLVVVFILLRVGFG